MLYFTLSSFCFVQAFFSGWPVTFISMNLTKLWMPIDACLKSNPLNICQNGILTDNMTIFPKTLNAVILASFRFLKTTVSVIKICNDILRNLLCKDRPKIRVWPPDYFKFSEKFSFLIWVSAFLLKSLSALSLRSVFFYYFQNNLRPSFIYSPSMPCMFCFISMTQISLHTRIPKCIKHKYVLWYTFIYLFIKFIFMLDIWVK